MNANPLYQKIFFFNHYFSSIFCFLAKLLMLLGLLLLRFVGNCWYLLLMLLLLQLMLYITTQNIEFYCDCNTNTITQSFCFNFFFVFSVYFFFRFRDENFTLRLTNFALFSRLRRCFSIFDLGTSFCILS